mmetsp:Transcript_106505/g.306173  ORF Transcript_106505/g.306173 Transcript_106505/m.306173 type:complete len:241 (-) Transcript_106505:1179-1901(-)
MCMSSQSTSSIPAKGAVELRESGRPIDAAVRLLGAPICELIAGHGLVSPNGSAVAVEGMLPGIPNASRSMANTLWQIRSCVWRIWSSLWFVTDWFDSIVLMRLNISCTCFSMRWTSMEAFDVASFQIPSQKSWIDKLSLSSTFRALNTSKGSPMDVASCKTCTSAASMFMISSRETCPELSSSNLTNMSLSFLTSLALRCSSYMRWTSLSALACSIAPLTIIAVTKFISTMGTTRMTHVK